MTENIWEGVVIGAAGGSVAGLVLWIVGRLHEYELQCRDRRRIYEWLERVTKPQDSKAWRSTRSIASYNNLTEDRVRFICSHHPKIDLSSGENEVWAIKGRGRDESESGIVW